MSNLSVVIPSYNETEVLRRTLGRLREELPGAEVIVVDGSTHDRSARMVQSEFPEVRLLVRPNYGWGHATNRGLRCAERRFVLMMNSDSFIDRTAIDAMIAELDASPDVGAVGPVLVDESGAREKVFGWVNLRNYLPVRGPSEVAVLSGACLMTRRDVLEQVGGIDERFHFYNEDIDWCFRVRRAGYVLRRLPQRVVHLGGASTPRSPLYKLEARRGLLLFIANHYGFRATEPLRRLMWLEGVIGRAIDRREDYRDMWEQVESLMRRRAYLESPFPLSGRAVPRMPAGPSYVHVDGPEMVTAAE